MARIRWAGDSPKADRIILTAGHDAFAVRREAHARRLIILRPDQIENQPVDF
jgi:hypothetical protein